MTKLGKQIQKGFTLIELMIVVAIIGILAAIAIPQYQDYVARSQVSEAVQLMGGAKTAIEEYVSQEGKFPVDADFTGTAADALGIKTSGSYVASITFDDGGNTDSAGRMTATMESSGVSGEITSRTVSFERSTTGEWTCTRGASGTSVADEHLPNSCENAAAGSI